MCQHATIGVNRLSVLAPHEIGMPHGDLAGQHLSVQRQSNRQILVPCAMLGVTLHDLSVGAHRFTQVMRHHTGIAPFQIMVNARACSRQFTIGGYKLRLGITDVCER